MTQLKRVALSAGIAALMSASPLMAKKLGGEIAVGGWQQDPSGWISYDKGALGDNSVDLDDDLGLDNDTDIYASAKFEHPIPIVPNIRVAYVRTDTTGDGTVSKNFSFGNIIVGLNDKVHSEAKLDSYDATLYYEVVDMDSVDLDVGLTARYLNGYFKITDKTAGQSDQADIDVVLPMVYGNVRVDVPFLHGLSVGAEGNWITYDGSTFFDVQAKARYLIFAGLGVEAGYRYEKLKIDDVDDIDADVKIKGVFAGVVWDF